MRAIILAALILMPGSAYRHNASVQVRFVTSDDARASLCQLAGAPPRSYACGNSQMLIVPNPCTYAGDPYAEVVCHELGHANGWNHSGLPN